MPRSIHTQACCLVDKTSIHCLTCVDLLVNSVNAIFLSRIGVFLQSELEVCECKTVLSNYHATSFRKHSMAFLRSSHNS